MDTTKEISLPYDNAVSLVTRMNELLNEYGVLDSSGTEIAQMDMSPANPGWLFALACGSLHTAWQTQLRKAYAALDPQSCEEDQVLVLAAIAGVIRESGSPSHLSARIENNGQEQAEVPVGSAFVDSSTNTTWVTNASTTLAPKGEVGSSAILTLYSTVNASVSVSSGTRLSSTDGLDVKCESVSNSAGGEDIESIASLRNRITQGVYATDPIMKATVAIQSLQGIENCSIWFNETLRDKEFGNKTVPPRSAYVSVKGMDYSGRLAEKYCLYMNVPASLGEQESVVRIGRQDMVVKFDYAAEREVSVTITVDRSTIKEGTVPYIKNLVLERSGTLGCGENVTSQMVSEWIANLGYGNILGCTIGEDNGLSSDLNPDEFAVFTEDTVSVVYA